MKRLVASALVPLVGLLVTLSGCGGGSSPPPPPPPPAITVSVSPTSPNVSAATIQTFTATVNNDSASKGVTWALSCSSALCGWLLPTSTASGMATTYIAPSVPPSMSPAVKLTATSVSDPTRSDSTTITVVSATPDFAYTANFTGTISAFSIGPNSGVPSAVSGSPFAGGNRPFALTVDRLGKFLYVPNDVANNVSAFTIDSSTGALTSVAGSPFAVGGYPQSVAVDPTGRFAYVANSNSNDVSGFTIDANTGVLTPIQGSPFASADNPMSVAVDPSGRFAYVGSSLFPSISSFNINATTGALTPMANSPLGLPGPGCNYASTAVGPSDKFVYMLSTCNGVYAFAISPATGTLTLVAGSPFGGSSTFNLRSLAVEPTGRFAYVADAYSSKLLAFTIDATTGALSPIPGSPFAAGVFSVSVAVDPSGKFAYVADDGANNVLGFTIDMTTGALTPMTGSPFPTGVQPVSVVVTNKIH